MQTCPVQFIVRDRDSKVTEQFYTIVENDGIAFELTPPVHET
jgi:hypothetical protein